MDLELILKEIATQHQAELTALVDQAITTQIPMDPTITLMTMDPLTIALQVGLQHTRAQVELHPKEGNK